MNDFILNGWQILVLCLFMILYGFYMGRHYGQRVWKFFQWLRVLYKKHKRFNKQKLKSISIQK